MVRQAGEKAQDLAALLVRPAIEQLPIGGRAAVHSPEVPGSKFVVWPQGAQAHLLVVAQEHGHIGCVHDHPEDVHPQGTPVDHIAQDVEMILCGKVDQLQYLLKLVQLTVDV